MGFAGLLVAITLGFPGGEVRAEPELAPPPVLSPEEQLATFQFAEPGYRIELVASEPMVQDPVAITFDGQGRLWVVEMRGYMRDIDRTGVNDPIGRVSVLEDTDGDGRMDRSTVFADDLVLPRAILVYPDGVLIAESEPLRFHQDLDGDLVADRSTLVDPDYARDSIEHSANGLLRGLDNWIYNAKEGHRYRREGDRWHREKTEKRGQWGISQDDQGRLYYNYNHSQLHTDQAPPGSLTRNPHHDPSTGLSVGVTYSNRVFPIRPTRAANRGYIPGALDEEGRIKQFTSACSPWVYRESLLPGFRGDAFVCSTVGNLVTRNVLETSGLRTLGSSPYDGVDFLASTDERFRPVALSTGPDGALYVVDMYRGIVQDGPHMSPYLREHSIAREMDRPVHKGRIWRIVPAEFSEPVPPDFASLTDAELVGMLAHPAGWWRDTAQKHLVETRRSGAIPALREVALSHAEPLARLHALWTLEGLGDDEPEKLESSLFDKDPAVASAALRVLVSLGLSHDRLASAIDRLASDSPSEEVALQMVLSLGDLEIPDERRYALLLELLSSRLGDPLFGDAAMSSLGGRELAMLEDLRNNWDEARFAEPGVRFLTESLGRAVMESRDPEAITDLLDRVAKDSEATRTAPLLAAISLHASALRAEPVVLNEKPEGVATHPEWAELFAWPGHEPEPVLVADVRPLTSEEQDRFVRGRQVYLASCVACHGDQGEGMRGLAPPLAGSDWVLGSERRLLRVLFHGLAGPITVSGKRYEAPEVQPVMPPLASLRDSDIAAVLTYIRREWGNGADPVTPGKVSWERIESQGRTVPWTEEELEPFAEPES